MTLAFEKIVRPFAKADVYLPAKTVEPESSTIENVVVTYGSSGSGKVFGLSFTHEISNFVRTRLKEERFEREFYPVVRIENPDDPSQYVEIKDTKSIRTTGGTKDAYRDVTMDLKQPVRTP